MVVGKWWTAGVDPDIYIDISEEDDPVKPILTLEIYNGSDADLYIKLVPEGPETWTFTPKELGLVPAGDKKTFIVEDWGQRPLPSEEMTELITLKFEAYLDSGYTNYVGALTKDLYVHFIDMSGYNVVDDDDFETSGEDWSTGTLSDEHYVTPPKSLRINTSVDFSPTEPDGTTKEGTNESYKDFTIPDVPRAYASIYVRMETETTHPNIGIEEARLTVKVAGKTVLETSRTGVWFKVVTPVPTNQTVRIVVEVYVKGYKAGSIDEVETARAYAYIDHVRVRYP